MCCDSIFLDNYKGNLKKERVLERWCLDRRNSGGPCACDRVGSYLAATAFFFTYGQVMKLCEEAQKLEFCQKLSPDALVANILRSNTSLKLSYQSAGTW
jgi:hypothetical protein